MIYETDFQKTIEDAFLLYGASVAQERAIPDVRDCLKIGLRQGIYAQFTNGLMNKDPFRKALKSVSAATAQSYVHGDAAMYDTFIRAGKPWIYRYPIEEIQGSCGNPSAPDNHSASRYVEMKAGKLVDYLTDGLKKKAVTEWYSNYSDEELIPSVFPSIGFWNIVNGCTGIAVALTTSVPQFNIKEVNNALIKIIQNPEVDFDEIYCAPDFAQGATILNGDEVKKILKKGEGGSIKLRAKLEYIPEQNMIKATEMPFGVFTNTIISQLKDLTDENENYGIEKVIDYTKQKAEIRIYLRKSANVKKMIAKLYNDTSLEDFFAVNMTMLDKGCYPKVFGWRQACNAYISHIRKCKKNESKFDLDKAKERKNIVDGLLIALKDIDNVIDIIKSSKTVSDAKSELERKYKLNNEQIEAILSMKLSSLTKMDSDKLLKEQKALSDTIDHLNYILTNPEALDAELINILKEVADKFGDERRTTVINEEAVVEEIEVEEQKLAVMLFDNNMIRVVPEEDMTGAKKGRKGLPIKPPKGANIIDTIFTTNKNSILLFTDGGRVSTLDMLETECDIDYELSDFIKIQDKEKVINIIDGAHFNAFESVIFITECGLIKKSLTSDFAMKLSNTIAIKLKTDDKIIKVFLSSNPEDEIVIANTNANYVRFAQKEVAPIGRNAQGVKAISLKGSEYVTDATIIYKNIEYTGILTLSDSGKGKISKLSEFAPTSRAAHGNICHNINKKDEKLLMVYAVPSDKERINIIADSKMVSIDVKEIPVYSRRTSGIKIINIEKNDVKHLTYC